LSQQSSPTSARNGSTLTASPSILVAACAFESISDIGGVTKTDGVFPMGASNPNCSDLGFGIPMPVSGTLINLSAAASPNNQNVTYDPTDGQLIVFVNGSPTALTCTLGNNKRCSDKVHTVSFKTGSLIEIRITVQTYATSCGPGCTNFTGGYSPLRVTLAKR
jgi:hypothetical protein